MLSFRLTQTESYGFIAASIISSGQKLWRISFGINRHIGPDMRLDTILGTQGSRTLKLVAFRFMAGRFMAVLIAACAVIGLFHQTAIGHAQTIAQGDSTLEAAFSPEAGAEKLVIKVIDSAAKEIKISAYLFDDDHHGADKCQTPWRPHPARRRRAP